MKTFNRDFETALSQIRGILSGETDFIANLANIAAILKSLDGYYWAGFYLVKGERLVLGPFQGPVACTRIAFGRGVCGSAWQQKESILVPDVDAFPGHIACNAFSKSEVVVPVFDAAGKVCMVIDVDSDILNAFDQGDVRFLEQVADLVGSLESISL